MNHIITGKVIGRCDFRLSHRFFKALPRHQLRAPEAELYACVGVDAVVDAIMTGPVAAGHTAICCIDDSAAFQGGDISAPEIKLLLNRAQVGQTNRFFRCQFSL